jgi:N6-adenosine-specific RNA methylase IME4
MKFDVVIADPPWKYQQQGRGAAEIHYPTMPDREIYALGELVQDVMEPQAVLLMWATWPKMPECIETMKAWGAPYKTCAFTWYKTMRTQPGFKMGGGSYTRSNNEVCLLGRPKGKAMARSSRAVRQVIHEEVEPCHICQGDGRVFLPLRVYELCENCGGSGFEVTPFPSDIQAHIGAHSQKPDEFYRRVQQLYAGRNILELFSRTARPGIRALGNEIDGTDIRVALQELATKRR